MCFEPVADKSAIDRWSVGDVSVPGSCGKDINRDSRAIWVVQLCLCRELDSKCHAKREEGYRTVRMFKYYKPRFDPFNHLISTFLGQTACGMLLVYRHVDAGSSPAATPIFYGSHSS